MSNAKITYAPMTKDEIDILQDAETRINEKRIFKLYLMGLDYKEQEESRG